MSTTLMSKPLMIYVNGIHPTPCPLCEWDTSNPMSSTYKTYHTFHTDLNEIDPNLTNLHT